MKTFGDRKMRCPHCGNVFQITLNRQVNNSKFRCPRCKRYNWGSSHTDIDGVLVGEKSC